MSVGARYEHRSELDEAEDAVASGADGAAVRSERSLLEQAGELR